MFAGNARVKGPRLAYDSDREFVEAVLAGEKAAYATLYDRYAPLVRAICYDGTGNLADAQDLAQDVFVRAYERLGSLRKPDCFASWLVGIARRRCQEWVRRQLRTRGQQREDKDCEPAMADPSNDGWIEALSRTITRLPEKERMALHAFYLQGKSAESSRAVLGLSRAGFYRVLERARKRLERLLIREQEKWDEYAAKRRFEQSIRSIQPRP